MDMEKAKLALEDIVSGNRLITTVSKYDRVVRQNPRMLQNFHQMNGLNGHWDNGYSIDVLYDLGQEFMSKNSGKNIKTQN